MPEVGPTNQPTSVSSSPQTKKPINWKLIGIIAVIAAIVIGALGYAAVALDIFGTKEPAQTTIPTTKTATPSTTPKEKEEPKPKDETADWKTFTYENPKISFKYPKNWFINVEPEVNNEGNFTVSISSYNPVDIKDYPSDLPNKWILLEVFASKKSTTSGSENSKLYEFISSQSLNAQVEKDKFYLVKTKSFQLDSYSAVRYTSEPTPDAGTEYYFRDNVLVDKGSLMWKIDILSPDKNYVKQNADIFDQILSTFKLL